MDVSSTSDDEITLLRTWALTVTHVACDYTEQKFNAEKTGGDPVIPSPNLDTDLVMACDQLVDRLIKAYKNPIQMPIDIARYSKLISPKDTGRNEEREEKLLERCPPGHEGTKLIDIPATILDASGAIIAWYLPDALTDATHNEIWAASDLLAPMLEQSIKLDGIWRTNQQWFTPSSENDVLTPGCVNLSPAWFQQGHEVGSDEMAISVVKLTNPIESVRSGGICIIEGTILREHPQSHCEPAAIATAALRVMHPEQYWAGLQAFASLGEKARSKELPKMSETLQYWATVFNSLTVICNRETPNHRDPSSISECFDILTSVGNYSNARMSMPSLQLELSGRGSDCLGMVYEGCCSCLCWDSVVWMGKVGLEEVERHSILNIRVSGLDSRDSIFDFTDYRVPGFGFRYTYRVSGFGTRYPVLDSRDSIFDFTDYRVPGFGVRYTCRISGFGLRVSGLDNRDSILDGRHSHLGLRESIVGTRVSRLGSWDSIVRIRVSRLGTRYSGFGTR
ncbi:hypothetical protein DFJ58DRAFT_837333 [Suillus subalutaceus]|uniref:uncharacterized protein n=1 Tax=Suillus subalutaceus TaxID=48586 RepID=UPI001B87EBF5|nr:uncharacterized protein DFJ58DRAFT_837333 [Suillus subalutaceus]KAG1870581.1 hypothetical protein DFJ58DRAFT_837333 [Suillus subalutaceus]